MSVNLTMPVSALEVNSSQPIGAQSSILTEIYKPTSNIAIWQRRLPKGMTDAINQMLQDRNTLALVKHVTPENTAEYIRDRLDGFACAAALSEDIALIVAMFCCLFDAKEVGLRLTMLDGAMCPKFHVDQIPCRLVTTYTGSATQWLENSALDRSKLGRASVGIADEQSGLYKGDAVLQEMRAGDVALLKGSGWEGNENMGLVHRSPALMENEPRLLLTLDLI